MSTTITSKGQVTVPKRIREMLGLRPGDAVDFLVVEGHVLVRAARKTGVDALYGSLHAYAKNLKGKTRSEVMEEVRRMVAHEAAREGLPARHQRTS